MKYWEKFGRGEWIRTTGLLVPNQALYQAEPRPESFSIAGCTRRPSLHTIKYVPLRDLRDLPSVNEVLERLSPPLAGRGLALEKLVRP